MLFLIRISIQVTGGRAILEHPQEPQHAHNGLLRILLAKHDFVLAWHVNDVRTSVNRSHLVADCGKHVVEHLQQGQGLECVKSASRKD